MTEEYRVVTDSQVDVMVTSTVSSFGTNKRFNKDLTITGLKGKLELLTGGRAVSMQLELYSKDDKLVCKLDNDEALLGSYPVDDGMRIHVIDSSTQTGEFEDLSKVEKFELSQEEYAKRTDSVRSFKQRMKMGQFREVDPEEKVKLEEEKARKAAEEKARAESFKVGDRCEVKAVGQPAKRGSIVYIGLTDFKPGYWVGVKYDEPLGKNDGSVQGKRYFECPPKYGGFVKPNQVEVGDFPELDFEDDDEM